MEKKIKIVIMAGGMGTRIKSINSDIPKPMIPMIDKPILEYQLEVIKEQGFDNVCIVVGHKSNVIIDYFGDGSNISKVTGQSFDVAIEYFVEESPLGTGGALYKIKEKLDTNFILINGDIIFDVDLNRMMNEHIRNKTIATILTHPNDHPFDSGIIVTEANTQIVSHWYHKEETRGWYKNRVNAGIHILSNELFESYDIPNILEKDKIDLDRDILQHLLNDKQLSAYDSSEYVKDMGTPDRYYEIRNDLINGKVKRRNLVNPQKAVFLDRDGTINKHVGFLTNIDEVQLLEGVSKAIKLLNNSDYLVVIITNQPVIARGDLTVSELEIIHNKIETLLGNDGCYVDAIYYCPHHPDSGFEGEIPELKFKCSCRKPEIGLFERAARDLNIDCTQSWMIGDSESDVVAGTRAGCKTILLGENNPKPVSNLLEAIENIVL
uniref:NTP_transferase and HAD_HisB-N domain-containing protein n=1 Tax=Erysipelothrix tonsillarum TaxID=38402 RepID=A0A6S6I1I2_9FIRM|nr:NTP_transferase and HAD_HisB-N domain-containing protein [Erysipelothrix tonsillarum]